MSNKKLLSSCDEFIALMNTAEQAIEQRDLQAVGSVEGQLAHITAELESEFQSLACVPSVSDDVAALEGSIRIALERLTLNQIRLAGWMNQTGAQIGNLQQGAAAVRTYAGSVPSGAPLFEQEA